ncbi:MAG: cellulase family glycosylhydrolase [Bacteroidales bacterium]|jgi:mannan endo-1,4-beta-mannosidase|nr:cellulase family glycosylhydrolase [Bacteroidales bacterium]
MIKKAFFFLFAFLFFISCKQSSNIFVTKDGDHFIRNGKPYYYVGVNMWYAPILASAGEGGNRERLMRELDFLQSKGINNLRILVGADGERGFRSRVEPTLQIAPGVYNDTLLDGLDYLLAEMGKRNMLAVLYLNNAWEWSGGYSVYLQWAGRGVPPVPAVDGWAAYMEYVAQFVNCDSAQKLFANHIRFILSRENRYTGIKYVDDPAIMAWQVGNEPRAFSDMDENKDAFAGWMSSAAAQIKSIDKNHLVTSGSEGKHGCEEDIALFEKIHRDTNIDYLEVHIWPYNWGWINKETYSDSLRYACEQTRKYLDEHRAVAVRLNKPLVLGEFGYPRDGIEFSRTTPTTARDEYYRFVFELIAARQFAGCNIWGWGGYAELPKGHIFWQYGDDYTADPAQEEQGLNSVFVTDTATVCLFER